VAASRWRRREHRLPGERRPTVGVLGQDVVKNGCSRPGETDDERDDALVRDRRESLPVVDIAKTVDRVQQHPLSCDDPARLVESGVSLERFEEERHRFEERSLAEVVQTTRAPPGLGNHSGNLEVLQRSEIDTHLALPPDVAVWPNQRYRSVWSNGQPPSRPAARLPRPWPLQTPRVEAGRARQVLERKAPTTTRAISRRSGM
jgi:hypothetical protein